MGTTIRQDKEKETVIATDFTEDGTLPETTLAIDFKHGWVETVKLTHIQFAVISTILGMRKEGKYITAYSDKSLIDLVCMAANPFRVCVKEISGHDTDEKADAADPEQAERADRKTSCDKNQGSDQRHLNAGTKEYQDGSVRIVIPMKPYTKKNSQRILYRKQEGKDKAVPFIAPSSQYKEYERECGIFLRPLRIDVPVNVQAKFYMDTRKPVDLTNLNEALHDILVHHHVLKDDNSSIIVSTDGSRVFYDKQNPRTEVHITQVLPEGLR